jgi:hypothetical protein
VSTKKLNDNFRAGKITGQSLKVVIQRPPPLPSPTFSLFTGQWLDFHQLAHYYASWTAELLAALVNSPDALVEQHCLNLH